MNVEKFSRSSWNKFQPKFNSISKTQQYSNFSLEDKHKTELDKILHKEIPNDPYIITANRIKYYVYLYQSQWNALRLILLKGHENFIPISMDELINVLGYKYPNLQTINDKIKTSEILIIYINNGLTQDKIDELSDIAKVIASRYAIAGKLL